MRQSSRIETVTLKAAKLTLVQVDDMYRLFSCFYSHTSLDVFFKDLREKDVVFLLRRKDNRRVVSFSTLKSLPVQVDGRTRLGYFSGDTIVDPAYWGGNGLGRAFLMYLMGEQVKHPRQKIYWVLISKGYKTYLLLANNFSTYYPRFDQATPPQFRQMIAAFGQTLYPQHFDAQRGVICFLGKTQGEKDRLVDGVANITAAMCQKSPKISFFSERNPGWTQGDELVCVGLFEPEIFVNYLLKRLSKKRHHSHGEPLRKATRPDAQLRAAQ